MISLKVENISKIYPDGTKALNNVSFTVEPGEAVVLLGHNGSGKSTLFRCITSFEKPSEGSIFIDKTNIIGLSQGQLRPIRKKVGMVFQHFHLINNLSVFQNVLFGALGSVKYSFQAFAPVASPELREKAMECLHRVGLSHLAKRRADQLSGGQQQRVAIARMLLQDPEVVLADEPIASLDPKAGREVMDLLWDVVEERGLSVISILHQMDIAKEYGDRIIALKSGNVVMDDKIKNISEDFLQDLYQHDVDMDLVQETITEKGA
ncbi:phosphonate ABC transporter ATP-binding protein [Anaerobacillus alkaliphilus]|uniref:Phosphonate ABC transporter ATP-binding protein n=1 Tax=Anaerobacillus alkaliphilus TaxID=1548597 RepID=A0A4Q0VV13_9BACI|nr:phosphonate ABC transporter ATP-binding protein [Anaerobacillus alkaliphilus]RXJ02467.1 phosphonate ABC transporter ATP-binding protein [Anaerobacillus alkaliphilus]